MRGYERYKQFLDEEGYAIQDENNRVIVFEHEESFLVVAKHNSEFVQVVKILKPEDFDRPRLLDVCNKLNGKYFGCKFIVTDDSVLVNFEMLVTEHVTNEDFRMIPSYLNRVADTFFDEL